MNKELKEKIFSQFPKRDKLYLYTIKALRNLNSSASIPEIEEEVISLLKPNPEVLEFQRENCHKPELLWRLAWARTALKYLGYLMNSKRAIWSLTAKGENASDEEILKTRSVYLKLKNKERLNKKENKIHTLKEHHEEPLILEDEGILWKDKVLNEIKKMNPYDFEKLTKRILSENGFENLKITSKSHDGGIDGEGFLKIRDFYSIKICFECKRHEKAIGSKAIRNFRGALDGNGDRGFFITTSYFTPEAKKEARKKGASTMIDLIDGYEFCDLLIKDEQLLKKTETYELTQEFRDQYLMDKKKVA